MELMAGGNIARIQLLLLILQRINRICIFKNERISENTIPICASLQEILGAKCVV